MRARFAAPLLLICALALVACGSSHRGGRDQTLGTITLHSKGALAKPSLAAGRGCPALVANTLGEVAARIYHAAATGSDIEQAVHRLQASHQLAQAISAGDATAAGAALRSLSSGQIVRVQILKARKVFARAGSGAAIAPVYGSIPGTDARFVLSTQAADGYTQVARQVTGAQVLLLAAANNGVSSGKPPIAGTLPASELPAKVPASGALSQGGRQYEVTSLAGSMFPAGALRIALLVPSARLRCPHLGEQVRIQTLGHVGERIYREEADSPYVRATLRHIEADPAFRRAVAARDIKAIRAAIVGFFGAHIHVVRVRAYAVKPRGAQRFLYDLGGPYVLAPVHGVVRSGGKLVGRFSFAIQDDAGYLRLARLFTGAEVLMRVGTKQVAGTLDPAPADVPQRGVVEYRGHTYRVYSFSGVAFPSGPLRISLLLPPRRAIAG